MKGQCIFRSRKILQVLLVAGLLPIFVLLAKYTEYHEERMESGRIFRDKKWIQPVVNRSHQKLVILFSNQRSGSTFLGEIFNRNKNAFYLYEPLFPYTPHCEKLNSERVDLLSKMLNCDFSGNIAAFEKAQRATKYDDRGSGCLVNSVCFVSRSVHLRNKYTEHCNKNCEYNLKPAILSSVCEKSDFLAFKVLRICSLAAIENLYKQLGQDRRKLYVIHLVRDPRAIISSKLQLQLKERYATRRATELCQRMENNLKYVVNENDRPSIITDRRYMRVRYEDVASDPVSSAKSIYRFLRLPLPVEVLEWINESTLLPGKKVEEVHQQLNLPDTNKNLLMSNLVKLQKQMKNPYGTIRDASITVQAWRTRTPANTLYGIQRTCAGVMKMLRYEAFNTTEQLLNLEHKLWL